MSFRFWLFIAGISSATAVAAAAYGTHGLPGLQAFDKEILHTGLIYHLFHSMAIFGVAALMAATEGRCRLWGRWMPQMAAIFFLAGIFMFSGGIYYHILNGVKANAPIVPAGGVSFITGWVLLSLSSFGFRRNH
ncbi:MAG: DUF423 domain-containing protein [Alphaproteobacteria bacterium]